MKFLIKKNNPTFWVISDTHLIADELHDSGVRFRQMQATSAGKDLFYQEYALRAFAKKVVEKHPDALIVTGDITFNGAKKSAERFSEIFAPLKEAGIQLLVTPGNHDIYDGWARYFEGNRECRVSQISPEDWKNIFKDCYSVAENIDESSLSYSVNLTPKWRLLFLDSNIYGDSESYTHPVTGGEIYPSERNWLKNQLEEAQKLDQEVLFFMHHNLYKHNSVIHGGFQLRNANEIVDLLSKYNVRAAFSGHIHAQHIMSGWVPIAEIVTSCFSETDEGYGVVSLGDHDLDYQRFSFDIENYLTEDDLKISELSNFHDYLRNVFDKSNLQMFRQGIMGNISDSIMAEEIIRLLTKMHWDFFTGNSYKEKSEIERLKASRSYQAFVKVVPNMANYINSLYESTQSSNVLHLNW